MPYVNNHPKANFFSTTIYSCNLLIASIISNGFNGLIYLLSVLSVYRGKERREKSSKNASI